MFTFFHQERFVVAENISRLVLQINAYGKKLEELYPGKSIFQYRYIHDFIIRDFIIKKEFMVTFFSKNKKVYKTCFLFLLKFYMTSILIYCFFLSIQILDLFFKNWNIVKYKYSYICTEYPKNRQTVGTVYSYCSSAQG